GDKPPPLVTPPAGTTPPTMPKDDDTLPLPRKLDLDKKDEKKEEKKEDKKEEKKEEKKDEKKDDKELPPPPLPEGPSPSDDPTRPFKGAVEMLKPVVAEDP